MADEEGLVAKRGGAYRQIRKELSRKAGTFRQKEDGILSRKLRHFEKAPDIREQREEVILKWLELSKSEIPTDRHFRSRRSGRLGYLL